MATVAKQAIREYLIDTYSLGRRGTHDGGSVTTPADASQFAGPGGAEDIEVGSELRFSGDVTASGNQGLVTRISKRPSQAAGLITVTAAPASLTNGDTFDILFRPWRFEDIDTYIDQARAEYIPEKLLLPLTAFTDGDMMATSPTTDWGTAVNATPTKVAATFPLGLRVLRVTASANDGFALTNDLPVEENKSYYLEVTGMIASTGVAADAGTFQLIDVTNSNASITLDNSAIDRFEPEVLANSVTVPSGCEQVHVRFACTLSGDIIDWSNLIIYKNGTREFIVQDRAEIDRLGKLFVMEGTTWHTRRPVEIGHDLQLLDAGIWEYRTHAPISGRALFYEEFSKRGALSSDTDVSSAPKEEVAAVAAWLMLEQKADTETWRMPYLKAQKQAAIVLAKYRGQRTILNRAPKAVPLQAL